MRATRGRKSGGRSSPPGRRPGQDKRGAAAAYCVPTKSSTHWAVKWRRHQKVRQYPPLAALLTAPCAGRLTSLVRKLKPGRHLAAP